MSRLNVCLRFSAAAGNPARRGREAQRARHPLRPPLLGLVEAGGLEVDPPGDRVCDRRDGRRNGAADPTGIACLSDSYVSIEKAEKLLDWHPKKSNKQLFLESYLWFKKNRSKVIHRVGNTHRVGWNFKILNLVSKF